ncbi:hypothetical protein GF362_06920 [Candidatus Dojkabacteria bacterium]|nr:hypothetical protein [Candidatus Dojkabacteria bacterium]
MEEKTPGSQQNLQTIKILTFLPTDNLGNGSFVATGELPINATSEQIQTYYKKRDALIKSIPVTSQD